MACRPPPLSLLDSLVTDVSSAANQDVHRIESIADAHDGGSVTVKNFDRADTWPSIVAFVPNALAHLCRASAPIRDEDNAASTANPTRIPTRVPVMIAFDNDAQLDVPPEFAPALAGDDAWGARDGHASTQPTGNWDEADRDAPAEPTGAWDGHDVAANTDARNILPTDEEGDDNRSVSNSGDEEGDDNNSVSDAGYATPPTGGDGQDAPGHYTPCNSDANVRYARATYLSSRPTDVETLDDYFTVGFMPSKKSNNRRDDELDNSRGRETATATGASTTMSAFDGASAEATRSSSQGVAVKLEVHTHRHDFIAHLKIVFNFSWLDGDGRQQRSQAWLILHKDNTAAITVRGASSIPAVFHDIPEERFRTSTGTRLVEIVYRSGSVWAVNLSASSDYGPHESVVENLRRFAVHGGRILVAADNATSLSDAIPEYVRHRDGELVDPMLRFYDGTYKNVNYRAKAMIPSGTMGVPKHRAPTRVAFRNSVEFMTYHAAGLSREIESEKRRTEPAYRRQLARFMSIPGSGNEATLLMLIEEDPGEPLPIQEGDKIVARMHVLNPRDIRDLDWTGTRDLTLPTVRGGDQLYIIRRPYDKETETFLGGDPSELGMIPSMGGVQAIDAAALAYLDQAEPHAVDLRIVADPRTTKRQDSNLGATWELMKRERKQDPHGISVLEDVLCAARFDRLPRLNILENLTADELATLRENLGDGQDGFVDSLQSMPGGWALLAGAAGSGKTATVIRCLFHLLSSAHAQAAQKDGHRRGLGALIVTPINNNADKIVFDCLEARGRDKERYADVIIIRKFSKTTERKIFTHAHDKNLESNRPVKQDLDAAATALQDAAEGAKMLFTLYKKRFEHPFGPDRRVTDQGMANSISHWLHLALHREEEGEPRYVTRARAAIQPALLRRLADKLQQYADLDEMDSETRSGLLQVFRDAAAQLLHAADFIVATASAASDPALWLQLAPFVMVMDEAAKPNALDSLCFAQYPGCHYRIFLGDTFQSRPQSISTPADNAFVGQLNLSLFGRLILSGFPCLHLTTQYRFGDAIAHFLGDTFYRQQMTCAASAAVNLHIGQTAFQSWSSEALKLDTTLAMLNVKSTKCQKVSARGSSYNAGTAAGVWSIIDSLCDSETAPFRPADIGIVTPYAAQRTLHENVAHARAARAGTANGDHGFMIETAERAQSLARNILIVDIPNTDTLGFLAQTTRLCTALSRVRYGLIIILDVDAIESISNVKGKSIERIIKYFKQQGLIRQLLLPGRDDPIWSYMPILDRRTYRAVPRVIVTDEVANINADDTHVAAREDPDAAPSEPAPLHDANTVEEVRDAEDPTDTKLDEATKDEPAPLHNANAVEEVKDTEDSTDTKLDEATAKDDHAVEEVKDAEQSTDTKLDEATKDEPAPLHDANAAEEVKDAEQSTDTNIDEATAGDVDKSGREP